MTAASEAELTEPVEHEEPTEPTEEPAETPDGEPNEETAAPEEAPADDNGQDEARVRMIDKALEKEHKRHERSLQALYAEEWESRTMCPLCIGEGFVLPWQAGELPAEQLDAIDAIAGRYAPPSYVEDPDYETCAHCEGWGKTITGSQNPEHLTKLCDKCSGNGYKQKLPTYAVVTPIGPGTEIGATEVRAPVNYGAPVNPDDWGRPAGHVHYGIPPQFVTA